MCEGEVEAAEVKVIASTTNSQLPQILNSFSVAAYVLRLYTRKYSPDICDLIEMGN